MVALHWLIAKGAVPLPAVKKKEHADDILGCIGWALTKEEVEELDKVAGVKMPKYKTRRDYYQNSNGYFAAPTY